MASFMIPRLDKEMFNMCGDSMWWFFLLFGSFIDFGYMGKR